MTKYHLEGRNSGGYRSTREIEFDGEIEKFGKLGPTGNFPQLTRTDYRYTYSDGRVVEDEGELLLELVKAFSFNEHFTTQTITRVPASEDDEA